MRYWAMCHAPNAVWMGPVVWQDIGHLDLYSGSPLLPEWEVIEIGKLDDEPPAAVVGDFAFFTYGTLWPIRCSALEVLSDLLRDDVELLPVLAPEGCFRLMHVTRMLDAVDFERSVVRRHVDGFVVDVPGLWLDEAVVAGHDIFRLEGVGFADPLVSDAFKERVERSGLTGLRFALLWDGDRGEVIEREQGRFF